MSDRSLLETIADGKHVYDDLDLMLAADWAMGEIDRLQAALSAATEWGPMATAPKDGTAILILWEGAIEIGKWSEDGDAPGWLMNTWQLSHPAGWLPLPALPKGVADAKP